MLNKNDQQLINEIKSVAADGCQFYSLIAKRMVNSEIRMLFREMALVRSEIINDIHKRFTGLNNDKPCNTELVLTMRAIYQLVQNEFEENSDNTCLANMEEMEWRALEILKISVRSMKNRRMSSYLAGHLANLQLSQDRLLRLKTVGLGQRRAS